MRNLRQHFCSLCHSPGPRPFDADGHLIEPLAGDVPAPLVESFEQLIEIHRESRAVNRDFDMKIGLLAIDVSNDRMHTIAVFLIAGVGERCISTEIAMTVDVGDQHVIAGHWDGKFIGDIHRGSMSWIRFPDRRLLLGRPQLVSPAGWIPEQQKMKSCAFAFRRPGLMNT